jgi:hypothetical protein
LLALGVANVGSALVRGFRRRALAAADGPLGPLRWFVLKVEANVEVDFTALEAWRRCAKTSPSAVPYSRSPGSSRTCWPG